MRCRSEKDPYRMAVFADVSTHLIVRSAQNSWAVAGSTCLLSARSHLLPTTSLHTESCCVYFAISASHRSTFSKDSCAEALSGPHAQGACKQSHAVHILRCPREQIHNLRTFPCRNNVCISRACALSRAVCTVPCPRAIQHLLLQRRG